MAERVLGKAVHPAAIERLFEVWPKAQVEVRHSYFMGSRPSGRRVELRRTVVEIWEGEKNPILLPAVYPINHRHVTRSAVCHPEDTFDRRVGIRLAFDRCLREAVRRAEPDRVLTGKRKDR